MNTVRIDDRMDTETDAGRRKAAWRRVRNTCPGGRAAARTGAGTESRQAYLEQAVWLKRMAENGQRRLVQLQDMTCRTASQSPVPGARGGNEQRLQEVISEIADIRKEINEQTARMLRKQREIAFVIAGVSVPELRTLLECRYLADMTWDEIAGKLHYSRRHLTRLHMKALQALDLPDIPELR